MSTTKQMGAKQIDAEQAKHEEQLVREHLPLVQYVVSEVAHRVPNHVSRSDLVSAGMLSVLLYPMLARVRPQRVRDREEAPGLGFHPVSG